MPEVDEDELDHLIFWFVSCLFGETLKMTNKEQLFLVSFVLTFYSKKQSFQKVKRQT